MEVKLFHMRSFTPPGGMDWLPLAPSKASSSSDRSPDRPSYRNRCLQHQLHRSSANEP
jgi:hypothetical protein